MSMPQLAVQVKCKSAQNVRRLSSLEKQKKKPNNKLFMIAS